jgi:hypothetical protein
MNSIIALPIAAALPVAAPAIAAEQPDDNAAMLARAEQIVETLRTKYVADGWTLFEPAAEDMLGFFRRRLEGKPERDNEFKQDVVEFLGAHGQSLDWVLFGDPNVMICRLAAATSKERGEPDQALIDLTDQYCAAAAEFDRLNKIANDFEDDRLGNNEPPENLRVRASDTALNIPQPDDASGRHRIHGFEFYDLGEVEKLRKSKWTDWERTGKTDYDDGGFTVTVRYKQPSPEARARADEIIQAYDQWLRAAERLPRAERVAQNARDNASMHATRLEKRIIATRAMTTEGMAAKARCAETMGFKPGLEDFSVSIAQDLLALMKASAAA